CIVTRVALARSSFFRTLVNMARWGNSTRTRYTTVVFLALACVLTLARRSSAGGGGPSAVAAIERELSSEDRARSRTAARTLTGELPPSAGLRFVPQALSDRDQEVRLLASQAAVTWGFSELAPMVLPWLSSPHVEERRSALALL